MPDPEARERIAQLEAHVAALQSDIRELQNVLSVIGILLPGGETQPAAFPIDFYPPIDMRFGNGVLPGQGFSGLRIAYPPVIYAGDTWNLVGVNNDVMQVGISAADGKLYAGGGTVVIDSSGITIDGVLASGIAATIMSFSETNVVVNEDGGNQDFRLEGDTATNLLKCDAGLDAVLIGTGTVGAIADFRATGVVINEDGADQDFRIEGSAYTHAFTVDAGAHKAGFGTTIEGAIASFATGSGVSAGIIFNSPGADSDFRVAGNSLTYLFVVDGTGYVRIGDNTAPGTIADFRSTAIVFNEIGASADFRVETDAQTHALFVDGSTNRVGINEDGPLTQLTIDGGITLKERAANQGDTAAYGQIWVRNDVPCQLWYSDDAGGHFRVGHAEHVIKFSNSEIVINENGADQDLRVESNNYAYMFEVDGGGDAVRIGGASGGEVAIFAYSSLGVVINESGDNRDFRIEGDTATHCFFVDASANSVGIGTGTQDAIAVFHPSYIVFNDDGTSRDFRVEGNTDANLLYLDASADAIGIGLATPKTKLTVEGALTLKEQAAADADTAAYGQVWTKSDAPNNLYFTDDAGNDMKITRPIRYAQVLCFSFRDQEDTETGDGAGYLHIPADLNGYNLVEVHAEVETAGVTNTTDIQIHNETQAADMLSTKITIDGGETGSDTAATAAVIDAANDGVATNDLLRMDVDAISTTAAKGLLVTLGFQLP